MMFKNKNLQRKGETKIQYSLIPLNPTGFVENRITELRRNVRCVIEATWQINL